MADATRVRDKVCLILDDICDGGGTFTGLSHVLRGTYGARAVDLFVTHGIFSKGLPLDGIRAVHTTDSYRPWRELRDIAKVAMYPVEMG